VPNRKATKRSRRYNALRLMHEVRVSRDAFASGPMSNTEIEQMPVLFEVSALRAMEGIYGAALPPAVRFICRR
jgi:hypothetical protein